MAISCINGRIKCYWYADGYIRTTSTEYNVKNTKDLFTHLTNDAVQKNASEPGSAAADPISTHQRGELAGKPLAVRLAGVVKRRH